ncbi:MAG TPA: hypothetical protein VEL31_09645 [Ktedonobacteraceae bacterium]|nr:hypothetical protein [Ktedonobacteraceae bacterium]
MTPEQFRTLLTVLSRIADAFEEQNRYNLSLIEANASREAEHAERDERLITIHTVDAERNQLWREEQREIMEAQARDINTHLTKAYESWLQSLKEQPHE